MQIELRCWEQSVNRNSCFSSKAAPHSPRRQKLNLRMKSLSLDSPESTELHGRGRRYPPSASVYHHGGSGGQLEHSTPPSNNSRLHCKLQSEIVFSHNSRQSNFLPSSTAPSSPSNQRKLLYANRGLKTGSVDLPDEVEKSLSSASTSPCPSPVRQFQVPKRKASFAHFNWKKTERKPKLHSCSYDFQQTRQNETQNLLFLCTLSLQFLSSFRPKMHFKRS